MLDYLKDFLSRASIRLHTLTAAFATASPILLQQLGVVDLHPLFAFLHISPGMSDVILGFMPFYLAFIGPLIHVEDGETK
jgi:hypothetical protein